MGFLQMLLGSDSDGTSFNFGGITFKVTHVDQNYNAYGSKYQQYELVNGVLRCAYFCGFSPNISGVPAVIWEIDGTDFYSRWTNKNESIIDSFKRFVFSQSNGKEILRSSFYNSIIKWQGDTYNGFRCFHFVRLKV